MSADGGPGNREIARRLFAAEFDDASLSYSESDEERAPNYVVTPTGARVNRLFAVGVLTEVEQVNEDSLRGRVVDPTGAFVTYAGQYQPDEHAFLSRTEPPTFVALSGKARTFEPEDSDRVFTSVRPESINEVDAETRDRWVVSAAERTLHRVAVFAEALDSALRGEQLQSALTAAGVDASLAAGIPKAIEHYDTGPAYLEAVRSLAVEAVEQVAGERDAVGTLETEPDDDSPAELGALPEVDIDLEGAASEVGESESEPVDESESASEETVEAETDSEESVEASESADETATESEQEAEAEETGTSADESESEEPAEAEPETESEPDEEPAESSEEPSESDEPDELGDFDAGESVQETVEDEAEDLDDFDPEETVADDDDALTEDERQEVKEEFGAEFSTGSEVGEPGEAGIDVPSSEEELEEIEVEDETESEDEDAEPEADVDVDLESAVVDAMSELDDGDGADHDAVVAQVVDEHGVDAGVVEDAIQEAMMSGKCYEPSDGTLKAI